MDSNLRSDIISEKAIEENFDLRLDETKTEIDWRGIVANWVSLIALGCLLAGIIGTAALYCYAWNRGLYPHPNVPQILTGGPWSHDKELSSRETFTVLNPFFYAFVLAIFSLPFRLNQRAGWILGLSAFLFFIVFFQLGWLGED